jgi:hypothetical protein
MAVLRSARTNSGALFAVMDGRQWMHLLLADSLDTLDLMLLPLLMFALDEELDPFNFRMSTALVLN